jgi:outer membrane protein assembly factor BamD
MKLKLVIACLLLAFSSAGCSFVPWSSTEVKPDPTAELLFKEGTDYLANKKYALAIDRLERVKTDFPFSPLLTEAELKLAETHYQNEQYPEAIAAFKEFQAMHPTNENIPFVIYRLGMAHFAQFTTTDRDQKMTEIAKGYFETLIKTYPQSPYAGEAQEKLTKCKKYLAEHEFIVATFYIREKNYPAARDRLEGILHHYPDTPTAAKSIYTLGQTYQSETNNVRAALAYEALLQHYPGSPFTEKAKNNLVKLEKEKEKQDPLALLLMRDGRPVYAPSPSSARIAGNGEGPGVSTETTPKMFAKKDIVYEEPGDDKSLWSRVVDTLNPFSSSSDETESDGQDKTETAKQNSDGSSGSFWSSLNPFASEEKTEVEAREEAGLIGKVDEGLKEKGVEGQGGRQVPKPPAPDLPQVAEVGQESQPPPSDPAEVLEKVDSRLHQEGKDTDSLPPIPKISPVFQASSPEEIQEEIQKAEANSRRASSEVLTGIDQALRQKGIEVPEIKPPEKPTNSDSGRSAVNQPAKVELDTNVQFEEGPLFLESGDYKVEKKAEESEQPEPEQSPVDTGKLPETVVTGPPPLEKKKPTEEEAAAKPKFVEEEDKSGWEQIKEDLEGIKKALNPFSW